MEERARLLFSNSDDIVAVVDGVCSRILLCNNPKRWFLSTATQPTRLNSLKMLGLARS
jgi:hypothetical protein